MISRTRVGCSDWIGAPLEARVAASVGLATPTSGMQVVWQSYLTTASWEPGKMEGQARLPQDPIQDQYRFNQSSMKSHVVGHGTSWDCCELCRLSYTYAYRVHVPSSTGEDQQPSYLVLFSYKSTHRYTPRARIPRPHDNTLSWWKCIRAGTTKKPVNPASHRHGHPREHSRSTNTAASHARRSSVFATPVYLLRSQHRDARCCTKV